MQNAYEILNVPLGASQAQIRAAYYNLARKYHPDSGMAGDEFYAIALAYADLGFEDARRAYDKKLTLSGELKRCELCIGSGETSESVSFTTRKFVTCAKCQGLGFERSEENAND